MQMVKPQPEIDGRPNPEYVKWLEELLKYLRVFTQMHAGERHPDCHKEWHGCEDCICVEKWSYSALYAMAPFSSVIHARLQVPGSDKTDLPMCFASRASWDGCEDYVAWDRKIINCPDCIKALDVAGVRLRLL